MTPNGATYFGLLAALRQRELLDEAAQMHRVERHRTARRGRLLGLIVPQLRRPR